MSKRPPQVVASPAMISVTFPDGAFYSVPSAKPLYAVLANMLANDEIDELAGMMNIDTRLKGYGKGRFVYVDGQFFCDGEQVPETLANRIVDFCEQGIDAQPLINFWDNLVQNPSKDSQKDLFSFLAHNGIAITERGTFITYKRVNHEFKDWYTGTKDYTPGGDPVTMDRKDVDPDRNNTCSRGLHVAAWLYAKYKYHTSGRLVVCEVNPRDVVAVPPDYDQEKMRVCELKVIRECTKEYTEALWKDEAPPVDYDEAIYDDSDAEDTVDVVSKKKAEVSTARETLTNTKVWVDADDRCRISLTKAQTAALGVEAGDTIRVTKKHSRLRVIAASTEEDGFLYLIDAYGNVKISLKRFGWENEISAGITYNENPVRLVISRGSNRRS